MDGGHRRDERRLHICMGEVCNNNCLFCMDKGGRLRQRHLELIDPEETLRFMEENRDLGEILFTAGEPTLHEDLERYIGHAKRLGFHRIGLITNGRRLAYRAYAERLLRRGLNSVVISIHGHTAKLHDAQTRTPGSFEHTAAGLRTLADLKAEWGLHLSTSTVVNKRNLPHLDAILPFLLGFPLDQIVLNAVQPLGRAADLFTRLVPRYTEIVEALLLALEKIPRDQRSRIRLLDVPPCLLARLPEETRGWIEEHEHMERRGGLPRALGEEARKRGPRGTVQKRDFDGIQRAFGTPCEGCSLRERCDGVWRRYVEEHGWDEFGGP
jgi:MoaA/NifB/PqqE/SkfB family radical SAM enzyme